MAETYLYRAFCSHGGLLYVGIATDYKQRLRKHRFTSEWWPVAMEITVVKYPTRSAALRAERCVIEEEQPPYNIAGTREGFPSDREMVEVVHPSLPGVIVVTKPAVA